mgnify:FL=1
MIYCATNCIARFQRLLIKFEQHPAVTKLLAPVCYIIYFYIKCFVYVIIDKIKINVKFENEAV